MVLAGRLRRDWRRAVLRLSGYVLRQHHRLHARFERTPAFGPARQPYRLRHAPPGGDRLIMHFNGNFAVGGSTQLIVDLIELASDAYRQEVVVPVRPNPVPYEPVVLHAYSVDQMQELRGFLANRMPDLVHIHYWSRAENRFDSTGVWYAAVLSICDDLGIAVVQNVNVPTRPMHGAPVRTNVFVSKFVEVNFNDADVPATVIYPGSDFAHFERKDEADDLPDIIGMVYRLDDDKLNIRSIEPFILVVKARPSTRCIIVGDGIFLERYRSRVEQAGVSDRFEFTGMVSYTQLPGLYARMGVFVAPVHNESFGQVTPFAMSMALPVAGYNVGALAEILGSEETLVVPGDEAALAAMVVELLDAPRRRRALGNHNRARAHATFSRETMVAEYRRLYATLASNRP